MVAVVKELAQTTVTKHHIVSLVVGSLQTLDGKCKLGLAGKLPPNISQELA